MTGRQFVHVSIEERVATVTVDHPPVNTLARAVVAELTEVFADLGATAGVRAVVLTGAGPIFIAGADIRDFAALQAPEQAAAMLSGGHRLMDLVDTLPVPVIAAVNGVCLGGGNELALACDLRIASDRARFGQPEINLGFIPGWGGTQRLTRLVGPARALELMLTGADISAQEALRMGLVNRVVPDGTAAREARTLARTLAAKPAGAVAAILELVRTGYGKPLDEALTLERAQVGRLAGSADVREGVAAFLEKRPPQFQ